VSNVVWQRHALLPNICIFCYSLGLYSGPALVPIPVYVGSKPPSNKDSFGLPNGISVDSTVFWRAHQCSQHTDGQTDTLTTLYMYVQHRGRDILHLCTTLLRCGLTIITATIIPMHCIALSWSWPLTVVIMRVQSESESASIGCYHPSVPIHHRHMFLAGKLILICCPTYKAESTYRNRGRVHRRFPIKECTS